MNIYHMTTTWALLILGWIVACGLICLFFAGASRLARERRGNDGLTDAERNAYAERYMQTIGKAPSPEQRERMNARLDPSLPLSHVKRVK